MSLILLDMNTIPVGPFSELTNGASEVLSELLNYIQRQTETQGKIIVIKNKLSNLHELISTIGSFDKIPIQTKRDALLDLQQGLVSLFNELSGMDKQIDLKIETLMNYVLASLSTTSALTIDTEIIGLTNILAQVLTNLETSSVDFIPTIEITKNSIKSFQEFSLFYNYFLARASLFASPAVGLPNIPVASLGVWLEESIENFGLLNQFVETYFSILTFIAYDQLLNSQIIFDSIKDILQSILYQNQFLVNIGLKADVISGLILPENFTGNNNIQLTSIEMIVYTVADLIDSKCNKVESIIDELKRLYDEGKINKNFNPNSDLEMKRLIDEVEIWRIKSDIGRHTQDVLQLYNKFTSGRYPNVTTFPQVIVINQPGIKNLFQTYFEILTEQLTNVLTTLNDLKSITESSRFLQFRDILNTCLIVVAVTDLYIRQKPNIQEFLKRFGFLFKGENLAVLPKETLLFSEILLTNGVLVDNRESINLGTKLINSIADQFTFQRHHWYQIKILLALSEQLLTGKNPWNNLYLTFIDGLQGDEIEDNTILYQKLTLYSGLLLGFNENGEFPLSTADRVVAFDPFTWVLNPLIFEMKKPLMIVNTSLDNLKSY